MGSFENRTPQKAAHTIGRGPDGEWRLTALTKASFSWDSSGNLSPSESEPILEKDELAGESATAGVLNAAEISPAKVKVDVLLCGALTFPVAIDQIDVRLEVGARLSKTVRVFGERAWVPGVVAELVPSRPVPIKRVPIAWERCYGGSDPDDPSHVEPRNPAGSGFARNANTLQGRLAPNFEDPHSPIASWKDRPAPRGFGPVAAHWQPRRALAGTYDPTWRMRRSPLLPADFDAAFFNVAPVDQQLVEYRPGEEVRLTYMTASAHDRFVLPDLVFHVEVLTMGHSISATTAVDTVTIRPEERKVSLISRATVPLCGPPASLRRVILTDAHQDREVAGA